MKIKDKQISIASLLCLTLYYGFARYLPSSTSMVGKPCKWLRYQLCKHIFLKCGKNVNVEKMASFGSGLGVQIGNNSGLGKNCSVPSNINIGNDVMMGPNCYILSQNHSFSRTDIPMRLQGHQSADSVQTVIEDDVWIGMNVLMTPGRHIKKGSISGGGTLLCKDFPAYSVVGGNPSKLIKLRQKE